MEKNEENLVLFMASGCLTPEAIQVFSMGRLYASQRKEVEDHVQSCEFCQIAFEGVQMFLEERGETAFTDKLSGMITEIDRQAEEYAHKADPPDYRHRHRFLWTGLSIAATILVLIGFYFVIRLYVPRQKEMLAVNAVKETGTGNGERGSGIREQGTGIREQGTGNRERGTGNRERGMGNGERGSGIREQGMGNGERGTGIREQGTGKGERGMGNGERGTGIGNVNELLKREDSEINKKRSPGKNVRFAAPLDVSDLVPGTMATKDDDFVKSITITDQKAPIGGVKVPDKPAIGASDSVFDEKKSLNLSEGNIPAMASYEVTEVKKDRVTSRVKQSVVQEEDRAPVFTLVEEMTSSPGGEEARQKFIWDHLQYPKTARESGISGIVYVSFIIDTKGRIKNIRLLKGIGGGCDEEAVRVIKLMPRWNPGKQGGKPANVQFTMQVMFTLD
ncbi:MAG: energy transducer TonB [Bacteroidetes bacterium]|nr:energy transducer TonB [Bacteroidota bacterium]